MRRCLMVVMALAMSWSEAKPVAEDLAAIPERYLPLYLEARPERFLVDPQRLLSRADFRERLEFLNYHASDSSIDLYVFLLREEQVLDPDRNVQAAVERVFAGGRPAVVVHYYFGEPERTALYLSPSLSEAVSLTEQTRALETSIEQAVRGVSPSKQLEGFMIQMSIRIYWMERLMERFREGTHSEPDDVELPQPLDEMDQPMSKREMLMALLTEWGGAAVAGGLLLGLALLAYWRIRRRAQYRFVDIEVEERLGGSHAAGIGAVISFASAELSPASQREKL